MLSWFKKYTILSGFMLSDCRYNLKEFLFVAVYAVACFGINHIVVWPVALSLVLLPAVFVGMEIVSGRRCINEEEE